jgi:Ankyrin repeat
MVRIQPEIIVARISSMTQSSQIVTQTTNLLETTPKTIQQNLIGESSSSVIASRQYDYWTSSRPWMRSLIGSIEYRKKMRRKRGKEKEEINLKLRLPTWLSYQAWEIEAYQGQSAWRFSLRSYRTLDFKHPIFERARNGDVESVKRLLCAREGFTTDRDEWGQTPLHVRRRLLLDVILANANEQVAASHSQVEVCQLLIANEADVLTTDWADR